MDTRCMGCMRMKTNRPVCEHCGYDEQMKNSVHQLPVGTLVGEQYTLGRILGQGGFGITYIGWDNVMNQRVAVKEYFPSGYAGRDSHSLMVTSYDNANSHDFETNKHRFLREAEALGKLWNIPQIVKVLRHFEENGTAYIAMEYIEGQDLRRYMRRLGRPMTVRETLNILGPVMEALVHVHRADLVHRDISPDNIMLLPDGSAKLLDFGAARYVENADAERDRNTSTQAILKHGFAPPEQYRSHGALGPWTDVYAMCATIYYCLTGRIPPEAMARTMEGEQIDWSGIRGLSEKQRAALEKGMEILPRNRFASVAELWEALQPERPVQPEPDQPKEPVSVKPKRKKSRMGMIAIAAAAVLAAALGITAISSRPAEPPRAADAAPHMTGAVVAPAGPELQATAEGEGMPERPVSEHADVPYKIGIITGSRDMAEEEYYAAQNLKNRYGAMVVTATFPDNYTLETEGTAAAVMELAADPQVKAIVFVQAVPGAADAIAQAKAVRDDILFIAGACGDDPAAISGAADICLNLDEVGMGTAIIDQAFRQGAKTFVHISFQRHLGYATISARQQLFKTRCAELGIEYVEATAPDPTGAAGVTGAQAWVTENIRVYVDVYGRDTAFFCTNCSMQIPLIQQCAELGAIFPLQCCPSPYHAYPAAFGIDLEGHEGDVPYLLERISTEVAAYGNTGRMSTWEVPVNMVMVEAGFAYAQKWIEGIITDRCDAEALLAEIRGAAGEGVTVTPGEMSNSYLLMCPFYNDSEPAEPAENMYTVTVNGLNVRSAPSTSSDVVAVLNEGDQIEVFGVKPVMGTQWGYIGTGWVVMDYVK